MKKTGYQNYKETAISTANKETLLLMLYEGAINYIKKAIIAMDEGNIKEKCTAISRAHDIINELNNTLDFKINPDLAKQLELLYMFIADQLIKANLNNDKAALESGLKVMNILYSAWLGAIETTKKKSERSLER